jgi:hypothetical protein
VKRFAGIILISVYLFSFAEFHNLLKIPVLLEHFKEHKKEDPAISFWSFIKLHYFDPLVIDQDYQRDQQLPFRDADCCVLTVSGICECQQIAITLQHPPVESIQEFHLFDDTGKLQFASFDIFQPPRCA